MTFFTPTTSTTEADPKQGYRAFASIAGTLVYMNSASAIRSTNPSMQEFIEQNYNTALDVYGVQTAGLHAHGSVVPGGTISFEVANRGGSLLDLILSSLRGTKFAVTMGTTDQALTIAKAYMESMTLNGGPKQLITGSISFKGVGEWLDAAPLTIDTRDDPQPYWGSGNTRVLSWSMTASQPLTPVFFNSLTDPTPKYIRVGKSKAQFQITTVGGLKRHSLISIGIGNRTIQGFITEDSFNTAKRGSINEYTYTLEGVGVYLTPAPGSTGGPVDAIII